VALTKSQLKLAVLNPRNFILDFVSEETQKRGISVSALANEMGIPSSTLRGLANGQLESLGKGSQSIAIQYILSIKGELW
jgi:ribosome-binding protein aMBF1 (putative translation factor)